MTTTFATTIDVRQIPPRDRHPFIFSSFEALAPGQNLQLVNDHDPKPLHTQFEDRCPGSFERTYLEIGPELWRVQIGKAADAAAQIPTGTCCSGVPAAAEDEETL